MVANHVQQVVVTRQGGRQTGQPIDPLHPNMTGPQASRLSVNSKDLLGIQPIHIVVQIGAGLLGAPFQTTMGLVRGGT